mmetsp:Transcript_45474/g.73133  ORF Transcript_45474/g.73133 Transcript_45474/m.73133 type:complete len:96 (-) Transcript_45474:615-902(-)
MLQYTAPPPRTTTTTTTTPKVHINHVRMLQYTAPPQTTITTPTVHINRVRMLQCTPSSSVFAPNICSSVGNQSLAEKGVRNPREPIAKLITGGRF